MKNEDSLSEYFSSSADFYTSSKNLLKNRDNIDNFIIWFDKCYTIDPRTTVIYSNQIRNKLSSPIRNYIRPYIKKYEDRLKQWQ